jgi:hypothetical protein
MPWSHAQWNAIAARTMAKYGKAKGRKKLHQYKMEAGGHAVDPRLDVLKKKSKRGR